MTTSEAYERICKSVGDIPKPTLRTVQRWGARADLGMIGTSREWTKFYVRAFANYWKAKHRGVGKR